MCRVLLFVVVLVVGGRTVWASNTSSSIWDTLMGECSTASFRCVQDSLHRSLEDSLTADFVVTDSIVFRRNENKYSQEANTVKQDELEPDEEFDEWVNSVEDAEADLDGKKSEKPRSAAKSVGGVSDVLYNRGVHYLMTHDLELGLPEPVFGGGRLRVSPRSIDEDGGVIVKINFQEPQEEGRLYLKHIKKYFKKKLMTSFMAAMLIIKLIKVKLMFLLPLVVGVSTAKKILLKVLLFLFPALAHLFKLCAFYHHHHSKFHLHHHHQVAHHHHHPPPVYYPSHSEYYAHPPPGAEIIHRSEQAGNELSSWGIEYQPEPESADNRVYNLPPPTKAIPVVPVVPVVPAAPAGPPIAGAPPIVAAAYNEDNFYSPILTRLDRVFSELGFTDEPCKERLVCSMYKAPARFSPHSNLVSAEISRDPSELQKPVFSNPSVIRFFRYVEAARSGQEGKDCLALFPSCPLLTE